MNRGAVRFLTWSVVAIVVALLLFGMYPTAVAGVVVAFFLLMMSGLERRLSASLAEVGVGALSVVVAASATLWVLGVDGSQGRRWREWAVAGLVVAGVVLVGGLAAAVGGLTRPGSARPTEVDRRLAAVLGRGRSAQPASLGDPWSGRGRRVGVLGAIVATSSAAVAVWLGVLAVTADGTGPWFWAWAICLLAALQLRRADAAPAPRESPGSRAGRRRLAGRAGLVAAVVALAVLLAAPFAALYDLVPKLTPPGGAGGSPFGLDGPPTPSYWGFGGELDTSVRGELSPERVLEVRADRPQLWTAATYDDWDGRSWTSSSYDADLALRDELGGDGDGQRLVQEVTALQPMGWTVVGATQVTSVDGIEVDVGGDGNLYAFDSVEAGDSYTVRSRVPVSDPEVLRSLDARDLEDVPARVEPYLAPLPTTARVADTAVAVTAGASTDYDRVQALSAWIEDRVRYDRDSPVPAEGQDAVDRFLFEDRVGFCEQIASALVVMSREVGVPARLAVGFVPSERRGDDVWISRGTDAHAWVEVWLPAQGWVGFDPTAGVPVAVEDPALDPAMIALAVLAVLAVVASVWWWLRRRRGRIEDAGRPSELGAVVAQFDRLGADHIGARTADETLVEYGARLDGLLGGDAASLVAAALSDAVYAVPPPGTAPPGAASAIAALAAQIQALAPAGAAAPPG